MISPETRLSATQLIDSVLALKPAIAAFDCDGTLWSGDAGADFFYYEMERGLVTPDVADTMRARYALYKAGEVGEEAMCAEMVTMNRGMYCETLYRAARDFFDEIVSSRIFPEMMELTHKLKEQGCDLWAVSSTNNWVVEVAAEKFGFGADHVLAACVHIENGLATDRILRVPTDELKAVAIREVIGKPLDAVFGNSIHDYAMLELARNAFCVNPNPDLEVAARERGWTIYWPEAVAQ